MKSFKTEDISEVQELIEAFLSSVLGDASKAVTDRAEGSGLLELGPCTFGPTNISDPGLDDEWYEAKYEARAVQVVLGSRGRQYEPINVGTSTLTVSTPPKKFGFQQVRGSLEIEVRPITVTVRPSRATVSPGDAVTLHAEVEDALDPSLAWTIEPAGGHVLIVAGDPAHAADITVSADPGDLPAVVTARSTADRSHLRGAPERSGTALLAGVELRIEPAGACVRPGETQRFTVTYPEINAGGVVFSGGPDKSGGRNVRWTASAGEISQSGTFTAPRTEGQVTITAVDRQDPDLRGEATVVVRRCEFFYIATGDLSLQNGGESLWLVGARRRDVDDECDLNIRLLGADRADNSLLLVARLPNGLREGSYPVARSFTGDPDANVGSRESGFSRIWLTSFERLSPDAFHAELQADKRYGSDDRDDEFLSKAGTVVVEEFDGSHITLSFSIDMVGPPEGDVVGELSPEAERLLAEGYPFGSEVAKKAGREIILENRRKYAQNPPRRSATVTGWLSHVIEGRVSARDIYGCGSVGSDTEN